MKGLTQATNRITEKLFTKRFPKKVVQLVNFLNEIQENGWEPRHVPILQYRLRRLKNLASTINLPSLEVIINKLNEITQPYCLPPYPVMPQNKLDVLQAYLNKLQEVVAVNIIGEHGLTSIESPPLRQTLIIGLQDKQLSEEIIQQVRYFSYDCVSCNNLEEILALTQESQSIGKFGAIILDIEYCPMRDPMPLKTISDKIPIIFISSHHDVATRLFAVQAGGLAYLVRPLEFTNLIEKIDHIVTPINEHVPYRILIIEDSRTQASIIRKHLEDAGMVTEILSDAMKVNDILMEFQPDLILLDLYMPQCSGIELAAVIRQQELFVSIPIVYLSVEDDSNKQLNAIRSGGDDFLTKPIRPHHLVAAVTARAQRSRTLRSEMIQDSLTGLLNHTRILEQLDLEIARAIRNHTPLTFAMIDIDHFKSVNDSHGHPVGDRVIKGLARLLRQRLRRTDSIGRYGGEEFAIILAQSEGSAMVKKIDEIRRAFSKLLHQSSDPLIEFSATFSAGMAELSAEINTLDKLVHAADKALYSAKEKGRNCIVLYN